MKERAIRIRALSASDGFGIALSASDGFGIALSASDGLGIALSASDGCTRCKPRTGARGSEWFQGVNTGMRDDLTTGRPHSRSASHDRAPPRHRRRGSVLVLVVTLLGVLFVMGIAFLASMNFEADLIGADRQREREHAAVEAVVDDLGFLVRASLTDVADGPFGTGLIGTSPLATAELPGRHSLVSPIEPYDDGGPIVYGWFTDLEWLHTGEPNPITDYSDYRIDTGRPSGVPDVAALPEEVTPVDADGDGICDALQVDLRRLGVSDAQIEALAVRVNIPSNPTGNVYLGLRVIPHGGLVNLNESHPNLIANVLDLFVADLFNAGNAENGFFRHRPTLEQTPYSPLQEEPILRRRGLLPPRVIPPSRLHGSPVGGPNAATGRNRAPGDADMWKVLFPPDLNPNPHPDCPEGFEAVYDVCHTYTPLAPNDPYPPDPMYTLWSMRMEPFTSFNIDPNREAYDRRHLLTTISHDDLLSRGGRWDSFDLLAKMREANQAIDAASACPSPLPFEYADYPQDLPNRTRPNLADDECTVFDVCRDFCQFDVRKGRLLLSLPWLDEVFPCETLPPADQPPCRAARSRLIHDVFMMLVRNARGPYWDDIDSSANAAAADACGPWDEVSGARECVGGPYDGEGCVVNAHCSGGFCQDRQTCLFGLNDGDRCVVNNDCTGGTCEPVLKCIGGTNRGERCFVDADCPLGACRLEQNCYDPVSGQSHRLSLLSRTAASLTANMLDFVDADDIPTRVALRSFDFDIPETAGRIMSACVGSANAGDRCVADGECPGGDCTPLNYVYGLERQPYITEIATFVDPNPALSEFAVELFNPYFDDIPAVGPGGTGYFLRVEPGGVEVPLALYFPGRANATGPEDYLVVTSHAILEMAHLLPGGAGNALIVDSSAGGLPALAFANGGIVYLIRKVFYPDSGNIENIVVDQFAVSGPLGTPAVAISVQRPVTAAYPWKAPVPVPVAPGGVPPPPTLGNWNANDPAVRPVEVNFANTGRFAPDPAVPATIGAFPTTGSMLLLMRHANRPLDEYSPRTQDHLAFTTWLDRVTDVYDPAGGLIATIPERTQIDNGRMPVFDTAFDVQFPGFGECVGGDDDFVACTYLPGDCPGGGQCLDFRRYAHHINPAANPSPTPRELTLDESGPLMNIPWGQFVFDYFTALPLSNPDGPYYYQDPDMIGRPESQPRVDQQGLRVHGRIDINAAPWVVLAGLPMMPADLFPEAFRATILAAAGSDRTCSGGPNNGRTCIDDDDCVPQGVCATGSIGDELAQAIVAYREARLIEYNIAGVLVLTGDYGDDPDGRGWDADAPPFRRGTGFMTVGELANVRHLDATVGAAGFSYFRIDGGYLNQPDPDYVRAIALLASLGDWMTVRSQVFTVYGTLRGESDEDVLGPTPRADDYERAAADVDSRAIRFQETIDRLPTVLGEPIPVRIGERVISTYTDVRND